MNNAQRFPYLPMDSALGAASLMPLLPFAMTYNGQATSVLGLVDSGSSVNVLPYHIGIQLGAQWDQNAPLLRLSGNLAQFEARPLVVTANVGHFDPVRLGFAWTKAESIPVILGEVNFFLEFDVCFFRTQQVFDIHPK